MNQIRTSSIALLKEHFPTVDVSSIRCEVISITSAEDSWIAPYDGFVILRDFEYEGDYIGVHINDSMLVHLYSCRLKTCDEERICLDKKQSCIKCLHNLIGLERRPLYLEATNKLSVDYDVQVTFLYMYNVKFTEEFPSGGLPWVNQHLSHTAQLPIESSYVLLYNPDGQIIDSTHIKDGTFYKKGPGHTWEETDASQATVAKVKGIPSPEITMCSYVYDIFNENTIIKSSTNLFKKVLKAAKLLSPDNKLNLIKRLS